MRRLYGARLTLQSAEARAAFQNPLVKSFHTVRPLLIAALLILPSFVVSGQRTPGWKPERALGSSQLSLEDLAYIVRPGAGSKAFDDALGDMLELYESRYAKPLEVLSEGSPKQALFFQRGGPDRVGGGFSIRRERSRVVVHAADAEGWCNGLYAIMDELMGARWYWAGELGFEWAVPERRHFPHRPWVEKPAFVQRRLYPVETAYGRRNRLNSVYSFNHNLAKVFTPELFEAQPELFAEVNGRRKVPRGSGGTDPQPDFTHPGAVEAAAQAALDHFRAQPGSTSYSLSINDNILFDTRARTEAAVTPLRYFRGRPDYTDLVFGFMNRVAERVFDEAGAWQTPEGEDRYLTALSYYWTEPAPGIRLHPRVMPVLTSDRAQWHDPDYRAEDKALIRAWAASGAERVATWDYYFGAPYLHPRQFNHWIAESLSFMAEAGVDVFFSQLPSFWGLDGAKAWLAAELLWDPDQDAEALLSEYYGHFFGAAAGAMRTFYETAEQHRDAHEGRAEWIKLYKDESGIALFTPEVIEAMRGHLDLAEASVRGDARRSARVEVVSEAFRLTEVYARQDLARRELVELCLDGAAPARIESQLAAFRQARAAHREYLDQYLAASDYAPGRRHVDLGQSDPEGLALRTIQGGPGGEFFSLAADPQLTHLGSAPRNFLGPVLPQLQDWHMDYRPSEDFEVAASARGKGAAGLRIKDADILSVFGTFPVVSNQAYELRMRASWRISLDNRVHVHIDWLDPEGRSLGGGVPLRLPYGARAEPVGIHLPFTAPNNAYNLRIRIVISRQYPGDFLDISELDFGLVN